MNYKMEQNRTDYSNRFEIRATTKPSFKERLWFLFSYEITIGFNVYSNISIDDYKVEPKMSTCSFFTKLKSYFVAKNISKKIDLRKVDLDKIQKALLQENHTKKI
jgi:hypothetical protein